GAAAGRGRRLRQGRHLAGVQPGRLLRGRRRDPARPPPRPVRARPRGAPGRPRPRLPPPAAQGEAVAAAEVAGRRLDEVVAELAGTSRAQAARWAGDGLVRVDGRPRPKSHRLHGGERLAWSPPPDPPAGGPVAEDRPLAVRFEDDHLLVVAKPP